MSEPDVFVPECGHPCRYLVESENYAGLSLKYQWRFRTWCCRCENREPCSVCAPLDTPEDKRLRDESFELGRKFVAEALGWAPAAPAQPAESAVQSTWSKWKATASKVEDHIERHEIVYGPALLLLLAAIVIFILVPVRETVAGKTVGDAVSDLIHYKVLVKTKWGPLHVSLNDVFTYGTIAIGVWFLGVAAFVSVLVKWMERGIGASRRRTISRLEPRFQSRAQSGRGEPCGLSPEASAASSSSFQPYSSCLAGLWMTSASGAAEGSSWR